MLRASSLATSASMSQGKSTRGLSTCVFRASVVSALHDFKFFLQGLHVLYDTLTVRPLASCSQFLQISTTPVQATLIFLFNNICSTLMCVYTYNGMWEKLILLRYSFLFLISNYYVKSVSQFKTSSIDCGMKLLLYRQCLM